MKDKWISVKEKLPEKSGFYYVWKTGTRNGIVDQADVSYFATDQVWSSGAGHEVTHWQKLYPQQFK